MVSKVWEGIVGVCAVVGVVIREKMVERLKVN